jgi:hypothetical protein
VSRRARDNTQRDERQRDRGNNSNVRYIHRQTDRYSGRYYVRHQSKQDGRNFNGHAQGEWGEIETTRLNPTAPRFIRETIGHWRDKTPVVTGTRKDSAQNSNN